MAAMSDELRSLRTDLSENKRLVAELTATKIPVTFDTRSIKSRDLRESNQAESPARPSKRNGHLDSQLGDRDNMSDRTSQLLAEIIKCNGQAHRQHSSSDQDRDSNRKFLLAIALGAFGSM